MENLLDQDLVGELPLEEMPPLPTEAEPTEDSLVDELNTPKDNMDITIEPDDDTLTAKDLLDDEQFKFSGEMLAFAIDIGAAYLLSFLAHQPLAEYRLNQKDLKKVEKVITKCAMNTKVILSPWQSLAVVLLAVYGMKIPQVIAARREYQALQQPQPTTDYEPISETPSVPVREQPNGTDPAPTTTPTDRAATPPAGDVTPTDGNAESPTPTDSNK